MTHTSTEQPEALLPCPFCGDHAETDYIPEHHSYAIECYSIGCAARVIKETAEDAIAAWNRRQPVARVPLSDERIDGINRFITATVFIARGRAIARAVEAAHGITQENQV